MTTTSPTKNLFELIGLTCGEDLMNYCLSNPYEETVKSVHGEGLDTLYRKALGSLTAHLVNSMPETETRSDLETAAKYNLFLVGLVRVDGCQFGIADLLKAADEWPVRMNELGFKIYADSGMHEISTKAGVDDDNVTDEQYAQRMRELLADELNLNEENQ